MPIVRRMMLLCLVFLASLLLVGLSPQINKQSVAQGILASDGTELALNLAFLLAAAGLGACFANLKRAQTFVDAGTFDSRHDSSYWSHTQPRARPVT